MDTYLFEYEMKKAGYKTPSQRAEAMGVSLSAYYRTLNKEREVTKPEIEKIADLLGKDTAWRIFFGHEVS
jgi:transcriptional regulator with XRE-family HTH domain